MLPPELPDKQDCDVLIVGGGPAGSSAAFWLASNGYKVVLAEKKVFPREKTCGDGLTPRAIRQLEDMGIKDSLSSFHKYFGLRTRAFGKELTLDWPKVPGLPEYGYVVTRYDLDALVLENAKAAGAEIRQGCEAIGVKTDNDGVRADLRDKLSETSFTLRAKYLLIADGANSRLGRSLGVTRDRKLPFALAIRGYYTSVRSHDPYIESQLDIYSPDGTLLPGYGWIFPLGDGRVNVGIGLVSTMAKWKEVNTTHLLETFVSQTPDSWGLCEKNRLSEPTGGKLPMGMSNAPLTGHRYLVAGDAAGLINPFNGEGISYAYESGRLAASVLSKAVRYEKPEALAEYRELLDIHYGSYYKVARLFLQLMGKPNLLRVLVSTGMNSKTVMSVLLKIMANLMTDDDIGIAETIVKTAEKLTESVSG